MGLGTALFLLPALVARWASGGSTIGNRYAGEISTPGQGGFLHQLPKEVVRDAWSYLQEVLRQSVLPTGSPLPSHGTVELLMAAVGATVPLFGIVGAVSWYRRHPSAESWMLWAYFVETLAYPYTNQRRVILVLPVVTIWYVTGAAVVGRWALDLGGQTLSKVAASVAVVVAVLAAGVPTAAGFTRDYLYKVGQKSSEFAHSPAMALLKAIGPPSAVVETDYRGSVAYFSGHRTAWTAFTATTPYGPFAAQNKGSCTVPNVKSALQADDADFLMVGDVNVPGLMDSPCLLQMASTASTGRAVGAVRLISTDHDQTSVFELVGPSSSQPGVTDWTAAVVPTTRAASVVLQRNGYGDAGGTGYTAAASEGTASFRLVLGRPGGRHPAQCRFGHEHLRGACGERLGRVGRRGLAERSGCTRRSGRRRGGPVPAGRAAGRHRGPRRRRIGPHLWYRRGRLRQRNRAQLRLSEAARQWPGPRAATGAIVS